MGILRKITLISFTILLVGCAQIGAFLSLYTALPDDNPVEESLEWGFEESVNLLTGEHVHLDLSGDSPEE